MMERRAIGACGLLRRLLAGLAAALAVSCAATPPQRSEPRLVTVIMTEYRFSPMTVRFEHGVAARLHLENRGAELHEFTAPAFFRSTRIGNPEAMARDGQDVVVPAHEAKDIDLVPLTPGRFPLECADHDYEGMTGEIIVE
jgi:plastocyanin